MGAKWELLLKGVREARDLSWCRGQTERVLCGNAPILLESVKGGALFIAW